VKMYGSASNASALASQCSNKRIVTLLAEQR
jgi:hypothetical protein